MSQTAVLLLQCFAFRISHCSFCFPLGESNPDFKEPYARSVTFTVDSLFSDSSNSSFSFLSLEIYLWQDDMKLVDSHWILWIQWFLLMVSSQFLIQGMQSGKLKLNWISHFAYYVCWTCVFKRWIKFALNEHIMCCGRVIFLFSAKKSSWLFSTSYL